MQSPDNFAIMDGLRPARAEEPRKTCAYPTLTFECNHGRVTRATRAESTDIVVISSRKNVVARYIVRYVRDPFPPIVAFKRDSDPFDDNGLNVCETRLDTWRNMINVIR